MRLIKLALIALLLISCTPSAAPTQPPRSTVDLVIEVASPTVAAIATDEPTFTPIPPTYTLEPTLTPTIKFNSIYQASGPKSIQGAGNARILISNWIPGDATLSAESDVAVYNVFSDGQRIPFGETTDINLANPLVAIEIITDGMWVIDLKAGEATATATTQATATKIVTRMATKAPTKIPAVIVPTNTRVIILPTNTPVVVSVPPNPPPPPPSGGCCKYCNPAKSKPCGDSCISLNKTCNVGQGCACSK